MDVSEQTVKEFNVFLFGKIRKMQEDFTHLEIFVPKLGYWRARRKKLDALIKKASNREKSLRAFAPTPEQVEQLLLTYYTRLNKMKELSARHEQMIQAKILFKKTKNESRTTQGSVQEPQQDLRGIEEQDVETGTHRDDSTGEINDMPVQ